MTYEVRAALTDLDRKTPPFFVTEAVTSGDLLAREQALEVLSTLGQDPGASPALRSILALAPSDEDNYRRWAA